MQGQIKEDYCCSRPSCQAKAPSRSRCRLIGPLASAIARLHSAEDQTESGHAYPNLLWVQALKSGRGSFEEQMQSGRACVAATPWRLLQCCSELDQQQLSPERAAALRQCRQYAALLRQQEDSLQVQEALPAGKVQLFIGQHLFTSQTHA